MSGMTIGENQILYVSYIGGNVAAIKIFAGPERNQHGAAEVEIFMVQTNINIESV